jgi:hypothetical protein
MSWAISADVPKGNWTGVEDKQRKGLGPRRAFGPKRGMGKWAEQSAFEFYSKFLIQIKKV